MLPQTVLNQRYQVLEMLGSGGMAVVYKARDLTLGRLVAIKTLRASLTQDSHFLEGFLQEARAAANLSHPNIVTVHDFGFDQDQYYIVMELLDGQDLKSVITSRGALPLDEALELAIQTCAGVGYAHRAGVVHCDLKPQNMLVTTGDRLKVTDFGLARVLAAIHSEEAEDVVWGTPQYFSPEQAAGQPPTPASDVYSLGVVIYEMISGRLPFLSDSHRSLALSHLHEQPPPLNEVSPGVPEVLAQVVHKVLAKEPAGRYRTADQLGRVLASYRGQAYQPTSEFRPGSTPASAAQSGRGPRPRSALDLQPTPPAQRTPPASLRQRPAREPSGLDWTLVTLAFLAFVAVIGLIPLWVYVAFRYEWLG